MIIIDFYQNIYLDDFQIKYFLQFLEIIKNHLKLKKIFGYPISMYLLLKKNLKKFNCQNFLCHLSIQS